MIKKIILLVLISLYAGSRLGAVTVERQNEIKRNITAASSSINTLECDFVQEKEISVLDAVMTSTGKMYFMQGGRLRWEYAEPYVYHFIMNGDKVSVGSPENSSVIDIKGNKLFRKISEIIRSGVDGSGIDDTENFNITLTEEQNWIVAVMIPLEKEMKGFFSEIKLYFSPSDWMVHRIVLGEATGDSSEITLKNRKLNQPIDETVFSIN